MREGGERGGRLISGRTGGGDVVQIARVGGSIQRSITCERVQIGFQPQSVTLKQVLI